MSTLSVTAVVSTKRAVIFDLFHTLTPRESTWHQTLPFTSKMLGVDPDAWNRQLFDHSRERLIGVQKDPISIVAGMARAINPSLSDDVIRRATENRIARFGAALVRISPSTKRVLQVLRQSGKRIGLVSNADVTEIAAWSQSPIADQFDSTIFSCYAGHAKPDPEIYQLSLSELGVAPADAIFVGDGGCNELEGARALGITTVMITGVIRELWPEKIPQRRQHADFVIEELAELLPR